jgi:hypothetical protein
MVVVLESEDTALLFDVLHGAVPLLEAAEKAKARSALVVAFRGASEEDRIAFARTIGADLVFDTVVVPAL